MQDIIVDDGVSLATHLLGLPDLYRRHSQAVNLFDDVFQHKLRSIEAYRSQLQITSLVDSICQDGPYEYLRDVHLRLYSSKKYRPLFAD